MTTKLNIRLRPGLIGCSLFALLVLLIPTLWVLLTIWTDRNLDFWLSYFKEVPVDCPVWLSFIVTFLPITPLLNVIGEVARLLV